MNKIKVLHLLQSSRYSGAENVVLQIHEMFSEDENIEMVYCSPDGKIKDVLLGRGISFIPLKKFSLKEVRNAVKKYQPDVIHAHDAYASVIASLVGKKKRIISHMHGNHENLRKISIKSVLYAFSTIRFKHIYWVSKSAFEGYYFRNNIRAINSILYNVIDMNDLNNKLLLDKKEYHFDIVYLGRLSYPKNPERLIKVLKLVSEKNPSISIGIIGDGPLNNKIRNLSSNLGLDNNITFLGYMTNPTKILHDAKVMFMTSRYEGTPMSVLEAMALGVPIVSTPTDGLCELVDNGVNGFLSDQDEILADKLIEVIRNDKLRFEMSKQVSYKAKEINDLVKYKKEIERTYYG